MPSLGEAPSGGAGALWLLSRFSKVTRRQGETLSSRYHENGYVPSQQEQSQLTGRHREQARSHKICGRSDRRDDFSDEVLRLLLGSGKSSLFRSLSTQRPGLQARRIR